MTRIREKFGLVGEMTMVSFISLMAIIFSAIGGAYAFSYGTTQSIQNKLETHTANQTANDIKIAQQLGEINANLKLLLKDKGLK